ncbi:hypothetical protein T11_931 [Trichinella zimbabwensis]|uniref:Uncharacterized protein n=1 Tax=Trichinella zimbabwensis TaxID=268475 RepID=A0A0V1HT00_9BILA|nr:hypothetical protein T11_931 [Trichinella zimbabwensis]
MGSAPTLAAQSRLCIINNNTNSGSWPFVERLVDCEKLTTVRWTVQRLVRSKSQHYNKHAHKCSFNRLNERFSKRKYYHHRKCDNSTLLWDVERNEKSCRLFTSIQFQSTIHHSQLLQHKFLLTKKQNSYL